MKIQQMNKNRYNVSCETLYQSFKVALLVAVIAPLFTPSYAAIEVVSGLTTDNYLLIDKDSQMILAGENYDEVLAIASVTKLMSYYVYMDKIEEDNISIEDSVVPVSDEIVDNFAKDPALSGVYFDYGSEYPLTQMFDLMMVYSDNGATKAIGEFLYGTEEEAVVAMNKKAKELGMENTVYYNTSGLTMGDYKDAMLEGSSEDDYNVSTAREQLLLVESLLDDYPQLLDIVGQSTVEFDGYTLPSFNLMLPDLDYDYPGVVGMKTGSSVEAGYCFVGYYIDPDTNKEYLSVVLDSESTTKRFNDTTYLYNWIDETEMQTLMDKDQELELHIKGASQSMYTVKTNATYEIPKTSSFNLERLAFEFNDEYFDENNKLMKDMPTGEVVGSYVYTIAEEDIEGDNFESLTAEPNVIKFQVVSTTDIKKEGFIGSIITGITSFFINVFESI